LITSSIKSTNDPARKFNLDSKSMCVYFIFIFNEVFNYIGVIMINIITSNRAQYEQLLAWRQKNKQYDVRHAPLKSRIWYATSDNAPRHELTLARGREDWLSMCRHQVVCVGGVQTRVYVCVCVSIPVSGDTFKKTERAHLTTLWILI